jgi:hypothetical protein
MKFATIPAFAMAFAFIHVTALPQSTIDPM